MNSVKAHISTILYIVILIGNSLPVLHAFDHQRDSSEDDFVMNQKFSQAAVNCDLCDFRMAAADSHSFYSYEVFSPQKEIIVSISLEETVSLSPTPLFSLRAPPEMIS